MKSLHFDIDLGKFFYTEVSIHVNFKKINRFDNVWIIWSSWDMMLLISYLMLPGIYHKIMTDLPLYGASDMIEYLTNWINILKVSGSVSGAFKMKTNIIFINEIKLKIISKLIFIFEILLGSWQSWSFSSLD